MAHNLAAPRTDLARLRLGPRGDRGRGRPGRRDPGAAVRLARHHLHRARQGRPAVHPGDDLRSRRRRSTRATRRCRSIRPFLAHSADLFTELQPGVEGAREDRAGARPTALRDRHAGSARLAAAQPRAARRPPSRCRRSTTTPAARAGLSRLDADGDDLRSDAQVHHPRPDGLQLRALLFTQPREHRSRRAATAAAGSGSASSSRPRARTARASPRRRPPTAAPATRENFLHYNPYPNTAAPGQTHECEAGNEHYVAGQQVIGNVPGNQGTSTAGQPGAERRQRRRTRRMRLWLARKRGRRAPDPTKPAPDARIWGRHYTGPSPWIFGLLMVLLLAMPHLPRVREEAPCRGPGLRAARDVRERGDAAARPRRCGSPASTSARSPSVAVRRATPPRSPSRVDSEGQPIHDDATGRDPPAPLPRGQLLPRPQAGQPERARARPTAARSRSPRPRPRSSSTRC